MLEKKAHFLFPLYLYLALSPQKQGELDWKVLCLDARNDKLFAAAVAAAPPSGAQAATTTLPTVPTPIVSLADLERVKPGEVERVVHWFSIYKKLEGGAEGAVGLGGKVLGARRAADVVAEGERAYGELMKKN